MTSKSETVAIFGSTGITGGHLLVAALDQGYRVRVMVRKPEKIQTWMADTAIDASNVHVVKGDVMDQDGLEASLRETLQGADYVISALGGGNTYSRFAYPPLFLTKFLQNDLMPMLLSDQNSVKSFVYTASMFSPKPDVDDLPWYMHILKGMASVIGGMGPQMEDHDAAVKYLGSLLTQEGNEASRPNFKIVVARPGPLADDYSLGKPLVKTPTPYLSAKMGQKDLALFLLQAAVKNADELQGQYPFLCPDN